VSQDGRRQEEEGVVVVVVRPSCSSPPLHGAAAAVVSRRSSRARSCECSVPGFIFVVRVVACPFCVWTSLSEV
jgi:hypothetical protein